MVKGHGTAVGQREVRLAVFGGTEALFSVALIPLIQRALDGVRSGVHHRLFVKQIGKGKHRGKLTG